MASLGRFTVRPSYVLSVVPARVGLERVPAKITCRDRFEWVVGHRIPWDHAPRKSPGHHGAGPLTRHDCQNSNRGQNTHRRRAVLAIAAFTCDGYFYIGFCKYPLQINMV